MPIKRESIGNKQTITRESFSSPESKHERKQMLEKKREERRKQMEARRQEREMRKKEGIAMKLSEDFPGILHGIFMFHFRFKHIYPGIQFSLVLS